jgi:hypothetical protein
MKVTNPRTDKLSMNHNERLSRGLRVKTSVRAGKLSFNHNETVLRDRD